MEVHLGQQNFTAYQYRKSLSLWRRSLRQSYIHNAILYTDLMACLYWNDVKFPMNIEAKWYWVIIGLEDGLSPVRVRVRATTWTNVYLLSVIGRSGIHLSEILITMYWLFSGKSIRICRLENFDHFVQDCWNINTFFTNKIYSYYRYK